MLGLLFGFDRTSLATRLAGGDLSLWPTDAHIQRLRSLLFGKLQAPSGGTEWPRLWNGQQQCFLVVLEPRLDPTQTQSKHKGEAAVQRAAWAGRAITNAAAQGRHGAALAAQCVVELAARL